MNTKGQWKRFFAAFLAGVVLLLQCSSAAVQLYATEIPMEAESTEETEPTEKTEPTEEIEEAEVTEVTEETEEAEEAEPMEETEVTEETEETEPTEEVKPTEVTEVTEKTEETEPTEETEVTEVTEEAEPTEETEQSKQPERIHSEGKSACICAELLKSDCRHGGLGNFICPVCSIDKTQCEYYCTCEEDRFICNSVRVNENCPVCMEDRQGCKYQCSKCLFKDGVCTEEDKLENCPVCKQQPELCYIRMNSAAKMNVHLAEHPGRNVFFLDKDNVEMEETVEITADTVFEVHPGTDSGGKPRLYRDTALRDQPLFVVKNGAALTLDRIDVSGQSEYQTASAPLVTVEQGGTLILRNGASLYENENQNGMGGAVYCAGGTVILEDSASITNNEAASGGGIYLAEGSTLQMGGNTQICGNKASSDGGGVFAAKDAQILVSGAPQIADNQAAGDVGNLYLTKQAKAIDVSGGLSGAAKICFTMEKNGVFVQKSTPITNTDLRAFVSDEEYPIIVKDGCLELAEKEEAYTMQGRVLLGESCVQNVLVILKDKETGDEIGRCYTDEKGIYRISEQLSQVSIRAIASVVLDGVSYAACADFEVTPDSGKSVQPDIILQKGYCVSGTISGTGSSDAVVTAWKTAGGKEAQTTAYGYGSYDMLLTEPICQITAESKSGKTVYSGGWHPETEWKTGILTADLELKRGSIVSGYVRDNEQNPIEGAVVTFYQDLSKARTSNPIPKEEEPIASARTDQTGRYYMPSVNIEQPNPYTAVVFALEQQKTVSTPVIVGKTDPGFLPDWVYRPSVSEHAECIILEESAFTISGKIEYGIPWICSKGEDVPQNLKLVLRQKNGTKAAEAVIDNKEFSMPGVLEGDYIASVVSLDDPSVTLGMDRADFHVDGRGKISFSKNDFMGYSEYDFNKGTIVIRSKTVTDLMHAIRDFDDCTDEMTDEQKDQWLEKIFGLSADSAGI